MHIPDGILDLPIALVLIAIALVYGAFAFKKARETLDDQLVPRVAVFTALVFAFQMLNFPVAFGTSGHLLGYVLLAIILNPYVAFISISLVLVIQALIFGDGGLLALGANIMNMGIVAVLGYVVYLVLLRFSTSRKARIMAAGVGAWSSVVVASIAASIELGLSESFPVPFELTFASMVAVHAIIGIGEGLITSAIIAWVLKVHPEFILEAERSVKFFKGTWTEPGISVKTEVKA